MAAGNRHRRRRFDPEDDSDLDGDEGSEIHEVDLHGCTVEQAERRLREELTRCRAGRQSPVHVITGKGYGSMGGNGVLKPAMTRWLQGPEGQKLGATLIREVNGGGALEVRLDR